MKYKKQIIIICLFTFLFLPFQLNKKQIETSANPLAIPIYIGVKEVVTALLLASGIVITGQGIHYALVNETYQRDKGFFDDFVDKVKTSSINGAISLKSYINKATDIISEVYKLTYDDDYIKNINMPDISVGHASGVFSGGYQHLFVPSAVGYLTVGASKYLIDESMVSGPVELYIDVNGSTHSVYVKWLNNGKVVPWKFVNAYPVTWSYNASATVPLDSDWEAYREANKDADVDKSLSLLANGSICADDVLNWDKDWDVTEEKDYPVQRVPGIVVENDFVPDKPIVDESETPTTGDSLWDTLFGWLKILFQPLIDLLSWIGDLLLSLLDGLKNLLLSLFVPSEGFFIDRFNKWKNDFSSKFFMDLSLLEDMKGLSEQGVKDINFTIMGVDVVLKLSIINRIAEYSRTIATGVTVIALLWYNYRNIYKLIRGSSPIEGITGHYGGDK